ncbi:uncharacterized protein LOC131893363 [Tigriopus californicus]|uniref:uncharacterized protein LOC131893363 n=1 Tax=Tigriopus californicus TaxID=6832 RepID=UPI0027D9CEBE|nr:uncharacterized protein LOC131893363 [Tigriopus californicus]
MSRIAPLGPSLCPNQHTGLLPYPSDCSKFVNCWKGRSHIQDCAPGTEYNQNLGQCDFPSKAKCRPKVQDLPEPLYDAVIQARSSLPIDGFVQPSPPSGQKVRLRGGKGPFAGYLEMSKNNEWGLVCDAGTWTIDEARLVCKDLGFARGVRSTTQGLIYGPVDESRKISEEVTCRGDETSFDQCDVVYSSPNTGGSCKLASEIVSIRCAIDSTAVCLEGEIPWGDSCYSLYFNRSTFHEAQETCQRDGKYLAEITDQQENDILSELLIQNRLSPGLLAEVWTGGIGGGNRRSPLYYWHGSRQKIGMFRNWWPGWSGERKGIDLQGSSKAVKLSRKFDFVQKYKKEEKLTDYYFWALDDFRARLAFLCERKQAEIGCIEGQGESYRGNANIGESGDPCMPWDSPQLSFVLDPHLIPNLGPLNGNNFCRNPDGDSAPWCIAPNGEFDYCDIPQCKDQEHTPIDLPDIIDQEQKVSTCKGNQFQCDTDQTECILSVYVCDGHDDCSNRADELNCQGREIDNYATYEGQRLAVPYLERWLHQTVEACALHCKNARGFDCKSFSYQKERRICTLHAVTVGTTGKLKLDFQWDYYELKKEASNCPKYLQCPNLKCLSENQICDGKFDCGEGSTFDEKSCETKPNLEIRLTDGKTTSEGKIEIRAFDYPFGGICDDGFGLAEANVVCRQLGFTQGALEALNNLAGIRQRPIVLDEVQCQGNESSLLECSFQPWM